MKFLGTITSFALTFVTFTSAAAIVARQTPDRFYLQTEAYADAEDTGSNYTGQYLYSYHTGAGQGIATSYPEQPTTNWFYLNGTQLLWTYENNTIGPWPVIIEYGPYQTFSTIAISIATSSPATEGFFFNSTGLQSTGSPDGWLACFWWFSTPQIFAYTGNEKLALPSTCSRVNLIAVPAA